MMRCCSGMTPCCSYTNIPRESDEEGPASADVCSQLASADDGTFIIGEELSEYAGTQELSDANSQPSAESDPEAESTFDSLYVVPEDICAKLSGHKKVYPISGKFEVQKI